LYRSNLLSRSGGRDRATEARRVVQELDPATVACRDNAAAGTASRIDIGLDVDNDDAVVPGRHIEDMDALDTEQFISPRTPRGPGRIRTVSHRQGLSGEAAWSPAPTGELALDRVEVDPRVLLDQHVDVVEGEGSDVRLVQLVERRAARLSYGDAEPLQVAGEVQSPGGATRPL
jgi:hypothetical protein